MLPDTLRLSAIILLMGLSTGCGKEIAATDRTAAPATAQTPLKAPPQITSPGIIKGRIFLEGEPPAARTLSVLGNPECAAFHAAGIIPSEDMRVSAGSLGNVFVYIKEGLEGRAFNPPPEPLTIENRKCVYVPHVAGAQVNQPVILANADPTLHNVHSYSKNSPGWNIGLPIQGMKITKKFPAPEIMAVLKCDVHPWMSAYLGVVEHPFFDVTGEDGVFELNNVPAGDYLIEAWHEKLGTQAKRVRLTGVETQEIDFRFSTMK